jgi:hypothetical protein
MLVHDKGQAEEDSREEKLRVKELRIESLTSDF